MEWISLSDRTPEEGQFVYVYREYEDETGHIWDLYGSAYYWGKDDVCEWTIGADVGQPWNPSHWLELPPFPRSKTKFSEPLSSRS